ncbi:MAG: NAD-dependent dihydropyrimidine dehydrogenase subunit PreA [Butyrivibrio sp.]|nr:NAD-dependent dihydropyrimidine dehydrogenase subunit PreA [Butyrivibrio sp.]
MAFEPTIKRSEMLSCSLCYNAPCDFACPYLSPSDLLRSIWFGNQAAASKSLPDTEVCADCSAPCEDGCIKPHDIPIKALVTRLQNEIKCAYPDPLPNNYDNLKTDICGIELENPFLLSSSVVASTYDMCARAFEAGWAGASFKTICNFDIHEASPRFSAITGPDGTIIGFKNIEQLSDHSVEENMEIFRQLKKNYPKKFILASIMGRDDSEWEHLAGVCQENGADAIELNFSCPNMMDEGLGSDIGQIPELVERFTKAARKGASIPILAKLTPNVANMSPAAEAALRGGADGISAINTIKSITDVNRHTFVSAPAVHGKSAVGGYSGNAVKPIALRFIAELAKNEKLSRMHISGMGGIECWNDALDFILLGAGSLQVTTAVMQYGYRIIEDLKQGLSYYLSSKGFKNVSEAVGLALDSIDSNTNEIERDTIIYPKFLSSNCSGCGRCVISCADGGHQAIQLNKHRKPTLNPKKCVGCHLCLLVCPEDAIVSSRTRLQKTPLK